MLRAMFGIGGSEILVILVVALLFLGPDKLPDAAKTISKGIRDLKKQSRALQQQIESDEKIGGAIRDLKSALRGDELPVRPPVRIQPPPEQTEAALEEPRHVVTLPAVAGEADPDVHDETPLEEIGSLIEPAAGTVAKHEPDAPAPTDKATQKHG
jgi:sec-independent protein translocase protein TatB